MKILRILFFLREYFFPAGCALCDATLTSMDETWYGLCAVCQSSIYMRGGQGGKSCDLCGRPLISEKGRCLSCRNGEERNFDRVITLFPYTGKYRKLLAAYKFDKNIAVGHFFADKIRENLHHFSNERHVDAGACLTGGDDIALVPVPPRPGKIKKTGWDQIECLAKLLSKGQGSAANKTITVYRCLKRLPSISQKKLNREDRQKNLKGRILLTRTPPKTVIVFDDVITTGSTLDACAAVLKVGGTEKVYGICLFYD
jgi:ComF family protein